MKLNKTLSLIALTYLIINILFLRHIETLTGGKAMVYIILFPILWSLTLLTVGILSYNNRQIWFSKKLRLSTIILLILCTPLSIWGYSIITKQKIELTHTNHNSKNGSTIKSEIWTYKSGQTAVTKFWILNSENKGGGIIKTLITKKIQLGSIIGKMVMS